MRTFLETERREAGWRFWLLYVVATNLGFLPGLGLERLLFGKVNVYLATALQGVGQSWVLSRHLPERGQWALATGLGWLAGGLLADATLERLVAERGIFVDLVVFAFLAGGVAGIFQWRVLRRSLPGIGVCWVAVAAVGWAVQFPGAVPGAVLARHLPRQLETADVEASARRPGPG